MTSVVFKGASVWRGSKWVHEDVCVDGGRIVSRAPAGAQEINAEKMWIFPGLVDAHVHFRDGKLSHKETYQTGALSAAAGGITSCLVMANGDPITDSVESLRKFWSRASREKCRAKLYPVAAVTLGLEGKRLTDWSALVKAGAVAFSDDGQTIMNTKILQEALQRSQDLNIPIILHEEDRFLSPQTGMDASGLALRLGLPQSHEGAESVLVARDLRLLMELAPQARVHVAHVSSRGALEELAKARGHHLSVTCEVTPHHLYFDHTRVEEMDGFAKMSPPLRSEPTRLELWKALCAGLIDIIATDHAPHGWTEKAQTFTHAPCGVVGCETAVSTIWTLCNGDQPLFGKLVDCMSAAPAKRFGLEAGSLEEGSPADLVVFDPNAEWKVDGTKLQSRAKHSPWDGEHLTGRVRQTWIDGQNVFDLK